MQSVKKDDGLAGRAAEPIESPHHERAEATRLDVRFELAHARPIERAAAERVAVPGHAGAPALGLHPRPKVRLLAPHVLAGCRDAYVDGDLFLFPHTLSLSNQLKMKRQGFPQWFTHENQPFCDRRTEVDEMRGFRLVFVLSLGTSDIMRSVDSSFSRGGGRA